MSQTQSPFSYNPTAAAPAQSAQAAADQSWKSDAFINVRVKTKDGKNVKIGALGLKNSSPVEAKIIALLAEDPSRVQALMGQLVFDFQVSGRHQNAGELDLSFDLG